MDVLDELKRIAVEEEGEFHPLVLMGLALDDRGNVLIRAVADEFLLQTLLAAPTIGRRWLHEALDRLCDGLKPPDDQPKDVVIKHFVVRGEVDGKGLSP